MPISVLERSCHVGTSVLAMIGHLHRQDSRGFRRIWAVLNLQMNSLAPRQLMRSQGTAPRAQLLVERSLKGS